MILKPIEHHCEEMAEIQEETDGAGQQDSSYWMAVPEQLQVELQNDRKQDNQKQETEGKE